MICFTTQSIRHIEALSVLGIVSGSTFSCPKELEQLSEPSYGDAKRQATIKVLGSGKKWLGYFDSAIDAAVSYDRAARLYHGEFAKVNFPQKT